MGVKAGSRCPHGCARCRAIEAGLGGRPLTMNEFVAVSGGLVEPSNGHHTECPAETIEAALAVDVAELAYQDARRVFAELRADAVAQLERVRRTSRSGRDGREGELEAVIAAAREELGEAEDRQRNARRRYRELAARDAEAHRVALLRANAARHNEEREAAKVAARKGVLARFRG